MSDLDKQALEAAKAAWPGIFNTEQDIAEYYFSAALIHARAAQEPVGSDRALYVCVSCKEGGEDYQLHPRGDMRVFDGQWYCTDCAREELFGRGYHDNDEDDLPLAPELYTAPPAESEDVVRLREFASAAQYALDICDKWTDQIDPSDECETEIIEAREHHQHNTERLRAALATIKGKRS